ncbi:MAG: glycosyltransferase family 4 protein [Leclercia sp.]
MIHELALCFASKGIECIVVAPDSNIEERFIDDIYDGVRVLRFRHGPIKDVPKLKRAVNESLLSTSAWRLLSGEFKKMEVDGVIYYSPSIFFGNLVSKLKRLWGCKSFLILRDLFPRWAVEQGIIKEHSLICSYFKYFEKNNYRAADFIGLMTPNTMTLFNNEHCLAHKTQILYNWATPINSSNHESDKIIDDEFSILNAALRNKFVFFYGGNLGHAQDMCNLLRLAQGMAKYENSHFLFVGQGDEYELMKKYIDDNDLINVTLLPSVSQKVYSAILSRIDVGLFSLSRHHKTHNFPGKLLGYMNNAIPILGSVNEGNDLITIIPENYAGFCVENGCDDELLEKALLLYSDSELHKKLGKGARDLLLNSFTTDAAVNEIVHRLHPSHLLTEKINYEPI